MLGMCGDTIISILRRFIDTEMGELSPAMAEAALSIRFPESDQARMSELAAIGNSRELTGDEAAEYDSYIAAADLLSLWKSQARRFRRKAIMA